MKILRIVTCLIVAGLATAARAETQPQYTIIDLGVIGSDVASQGLRVSSNGFAVGRSLGSTGTAYRWSQDDGMLALGKLPGRNNATANGVNSLGVVVGDATASLSGSSPLPVMWQNGVVSQLALPSGYTVGHANDINASNVAVGSVGSGTGERAVIYAGGTTMLVPTTANGSPMVSAFSINDAGLVAGIGWDANNAGRNVGMVYDTLTGTLTDIGALAGRNGAIAFDISNGGYVVGSSMLDQGSGVPFIWSAATGMVAIPMVGGASIGSARGVNSAGWAVGLFSTAYALPFLYDGDNTYLLSDLLPANSGWNLSTNTSSSAMGITDDGTIIGTGIHNGATHAYAMVLVSSVPEPGSWALMLAGLVLAAPRVHRHRIG